MTILNIHLVSDATGDTVHKIAEAVISQFSGIQTREFFWPLLRAGAPLQQLREGLEKQGGVVIATFADAALADAVRQECVALQIPFVSALEPVFAMMSKHISQKLAGTPGKQHELNADYYNRIAAVDFALAHDDGQARANLRDAQVILVGISRTSKTPTCVYLSHRGVRAANVPLVPDQSLPDELTALPSRVQGGPLIVGLTHDAERLAQIRQSRLQMMGDFTDHSQYADTEKIRAELLAAKKIFARMGWPVIDVTRRSIEETAAMILQMLRTVDGGQWTVDRYNFPFYCPPSTVHREPMLILASSSQTRQTMLRNAGVEFVAYAADLPEAQLMLDWREKNIPATTVAEKLAIAKAMAISAQHPKAVVIGADQMVLCGPHWLSKATGIADAKNHLQLLAGKTHHLITGTALVRNAQLLWSVVDTADMTLRDLGDAEIDAYVARVPENILHSVGCYQFEGLGAQLIQSYRGDYFTILGLCLLPLLAALREIED